VYHGEGDIIYMTTDLTESRYPLIHTEHIDMTRLGHEMPFHQGLTNLGIRGGTILGRQEPLGGPEMDRGKFRVFESVLIPEGGLGIDTVREEENPVSPPREDDRLEVVV